MFYGKKIGETEYGSYLETDGLETYVEVDTEEWMNLIDEANNNKRIVPDENGNPILQDPPPPTNEELCQQRRNEALSYLSRTDYVAAKIAEGAATKEEYAEILEKRREARAAINECDAVLSQ